MANSPDFVTHALDLLSLLGPVQARAMFGGHGLYARGVMFGLLDDDELFLKTDELCRAGFEEAGCRRWAYVSRTQRIETDYFRPPDGAHEDPEGMLPWAKLALEAALRKAAAKTAKAARPRRRSAGAARPRKGAARPSSGRRRPSR
jgi:DNA transformation protein